MNDDYHDCAVQASCAAGWLTRRITHLHNRIDYDSSDEADDSSAIRDVPSAVTKNEQGAAFCSRHSGTPLFAPKPSAVREYALATFRPSLWYYANGFLVGGI